MWQKSKNKALLFLVILITFMASACRQTVHETQGFEAIETFRDIPGITAEEIAAIENLQKQGRSFVFSMPYHSETFIDINGEFRGFTQLFCDWMENLFGFNFIIEINDIGPILTKLEAEEIDFSLIAVSEIRLETFVMSDPVAYRTIKIMQIKDSPDLQEIARTRPVRFVFMEGANTIEAVNVLEQGSFEILIGHNYEEIYMMLQNGEADAFIGYNTAEAAFDIFGGVVVEDFLPLSVDEISLSTGKQELSAIISLISKAVNSGAYTHLTALYRQGHQEYIQNKFFMQLTDEENAFLRNNPIIPFGSQYMSYPLTFYNTNERSWDGVVFDILDEVRALTDLDFKIANEPNLQTSDLIPMLESGEVFIVPYMIVSNDRIDRFLWSKNGVYLFDRFALLSKQSFPNVDLNDIPFLRIGLPRRTTFAEIFWEWFPNALDVTEYVTADDAFHALDRGEIDLVMNTQSRLTALTNYYELSDYKANFLFNHPFEAYFAFNKEQQILRSIIDKALPLINTERIVEQWLTKTYNIESMRLQQQRPWLIRTIFLFSLIIVLIAALYVRSRSEGKRLEEIVSSRTKELKIASEAKSRFLANISHEIRTPMNSIIGFSQLANNKNNPAQTNLYLNKIIESAKLLLAIINDILDISKIESGRMELERASFNLHDIFDYCQSAITPKAKEKGLYLYCYAEPIIGKKIIGDPLRLRQVLLNLLSNAVKFTNSGIVKLMSSVKEMDDSGITIHFEVKDSGIGISPEQIARIFDPFIQADTSNTRRYGGTGLGLTITKNIIEMMGGKLQVEGVPGVGSKFGFDLKFEFISDADEKISKNIEIATNKMPVFNKEILVFEDNKMNQQVICEHLSRIGIKTVIAENGLIGIEEIKKRLAGGKPMFDLIFMDIHMPIMDGLEAASKIKEMKINTPIVAMTANIMKSDLELYKEKGMNEKLGKPFTAQELITLLEKYFSHENNSYKNNSIDISGNEKMLADLKLNFYKNNQTLYEDILAAIESGDFKSAYRMTHTLKSNAGQIGEKALQDAAATAEGILENSTDISVKEKLGSIEIELKLTLEKLSHLFAGSENSKNTKTLNNWEQQELLEKLEFMLENRNPSCRTLLGDIQSISGTEELVNYIDDFEFKKALNELGRLRKDLLG